MDGKELVRMAHINLTNMQEGAGGIILKVNPMFQMVLSQLSDAITMFEENEGG